MTHDQVFPKSAPSGTADARVRYAAGDGYGLLVGMWTDVNVMIIAEYVLVLCDFGVALVSWPSRPSCLRLGRDGG
jgi:hypothetical protein